jgi:hypothetical protein
MPLVTAPFFALNSQYRPNRFVVSMTSAAPLVLAQASIVIDFLGVTSISKSPIYSIGTTYYFEFDVSKVLQTYSAPKSNAKTSVFPDTLDQPLNVSNTDIHTKVALIISYFYNDPTTGLLTQFGSTEIIPTDYPAIAGTRQTRNWQFMGMDLYIQIFGGGSPFLTNAPIIYEICQTENAYLTFIGYTATTVKVTTKDSSGSVIDTGLFTVTPNSDFVPTTIGTGLTNLATQSYFDGSVNVLDPNISVYEIQVGQSFLLGSVWSFFPFSEIRTYKLISCCNERSVRLHWLNRLGGADAYTFRSKKTVTQKIKSELAQKPQTWNYTLPAASSYDRGLFKIAQDVSIQYEAESEFYTTAEGSWISELLSSPEVYMETSDGLIAVVITDSDITISENDELLSVTISFVESNNISVQQN